MRTIFVCALVVLAGCEIDPPIVHRVDQKLRSEIFQKCMELLPAGPSHTKYNDWAEAVDECEEAAEYQSQFCVANCEKSFYPERKDL